MCVWTTTADFLDQNDTEVLKRLYVNNSVEKFLGRSSSGGISACKGMGKTFLLKAKRMKLQIDRGSSDEILILPKDQLVDTPGPILLDGAHIQFLQSYSNWVDLWISCIAIYLLSLPEIQTSIGKSEILAMNSEIKNLIKNEYDGVFCVLNTILADKTRENLREAVRASGVLFHLFQKINRPVCLFVDKLEEPFNRYFYKVPGNNAVADGRCNPSLWSYVQLGFAEAVLRLYAGRHHVKIYFGIRQEALYGCEFVTQESTKICCELITKLEYSFSDLKNMCIQYVRAEKPENLLRPDYANSDPFLALCGINTINHRSGHDEHIWAYLYRHTFQRPRDIMEMCLAIYDNIVRRREVDISDTSSLIRVCRHWVNEISTRECMDYLTSLEPFMALDDNITFTQNLMDFLKKLPTNVFTKESIKVYCHGSNGCGSSLDCSSCNSTHFFSTLYNIGVLGFIYKSISESGYKNSIKVIGDSVFTTSAQTLPDAVLYYAHPGLGNIIKQEREKAQMQYHPSNFVINSSEIFADSTEIHDLQHFCSALIGNRNDRKVFLTSTGRDLKDTRKEIKKLLEASGYEVYAYEFEDFPQMPTDGIPYKQHTSGETHDHCIDALLSCKHVIYIFGKNFGGKYAGEKYKHYIEKCSNVVKIAPSVSFVEYLVAKALGKNVKVYVLSDVEWTYGEWVANDKRDDYKSKHVENLDVLRQFGYFNGLGNGTWCDKFPDLEALRSFVSKHFPPVERN